jgi:hypothetical protein
LKFNANTNGINKYFTEERPAIPGLSSGGILLANFGFGFAF